MFVKTTVKYDVNLFVALFPLPWRKDVDLLVRVCCVRSAIQTFELAWSGWNWWEAMTRPATLQHTSVWGLRYSCANMRACIPCFSNTVQFYDRDPDPDIQNSNYFLQFRFRLLKSYSSASGSELWQVPVPVPTPYLDHKKHRFKKISWKLVAFLHRKLFYKQNL